MSARDATIIKQPTSPTYSDGDVPSSPLFEHATAYYQKKIIFACNSKNSNKDLTQLVIRVGRMHKNGLLARINADILLRLIIEQYCTREAIDQYILAFHPKINIQFLDQDDLKVIYDARVQKLLTSLESARATHPDISNESLLATTGLLNYKPGESPAKLLS